MINSSLLIEKENVIHSFEIDWSSNFNINVGETIHTDIREFSIPYNLKITEILQSSVFTALNEIKRKGFYVAEESKKYEFAQQRLFKAISLLQEKQFIKSFDECKKSYIEFSEVHKRLLLMTNEASISTLFIIIVLALTSTSIAYLMSDDVMKRAKYNIFIYGFILLIFYYIYPGSTIVPFELFIYIGFISISIVLIIVSVFPRFLRARSVKGNLPLKNIIVPIFSIAKRNLLRRRFRSILLIVSTILLVMSFVSLTSFVSGYGIIFSKFSERAKTSDGVLIRVAEYSAMKPISIALEDTALNWIENQPESIIVSPKAETVPLMDPLYSMDGVFLHGILGINPSLESQIFPIMDILIEGDMPSEDGIVISENLKNALGKEIGDILTIDRMEFKLEGIIDGIKASMLEESDGASYIPTKIVNLDPGGEVPSLSAEPCQPDEYIIMHFSRAIKMNLVDISRVFIKVSDGTDIESFAERLALERNYWVWATSLGKIAFVRLGNYYEGKGLPLLVPWIIVALNVVSTTLNSIYERRKEMFIFSAVGLNPSQIASIFVSEASICGIIAGGLGYLGGIGVFRLMNFFDLSLEITQKVSAFWSIASIGVAMTAIIVGAIAALRGSVIIIPSLLRKWRYDKINELGVYEIDLPLKISYNELEPFIEYLVQSLRDLENGLTRSTSWIKLLNIDNEVRIDFHYVSSHNTAGNFYTKNSLFIKKHAKEELAYIKLISSGEQEWVNTTGSLIRMIAIQWSIIH